MMNVKKLILQICFVLIPIVNSAQHQYVFSYNGTNKIYFVDKNIFKVGKLYRTWIKEIYENPQDTVRTNIVCAFSLN